MIEDTKILEELQKTNALLMQILEVIEQGNQKAGAIPTIPTSGRKGYQAHLGEDEKLALEDEIDLDWWFLSYGEEMLPAKYMHAFSATGQDVDSLYTKDEADYIFHRMKDFLGETNKQGTHVFKYFGKVWCKREKNSRNCFGFVAKKESNDG